MKAAPSLCLATLLTCAGAHADDWLTCAAISAPEERLACFDQKARQFAIPEEKAAPAPAPTPAPAPAPTADVAAPAADQLLAQTPQTRAAAQPSEISRFWDLDASIARDTFELRAYRPVSLGVSVGDVVNTSPSTPSAGHTVSQAIPYGSGEARVNLSVRTKILSGFLRRGDDPLRDSLWFGYTQQSYWQLFNGNISRPFRATDHEPELIYVFPHYLSLPAGWTYRMSGLGVVHQSNGQSLPFSRSWNRVYLMGGADKIADNGDRFTLTARLWRRLPERASNDDNPDISNYIGRGEIAGYWSFESGEGDNKITHTMGLTARHSLKRGGRGSLRLDYLRSIGKASSGLRFQTQLFSGYGDSLIDYNVRRTVLTMGLSLVDW
jgi:phospholipase A1